MDDKSDTDCTQRQTKRTKYGKKTGRPFACDFTGCGKRYKEERYLRYHKDIHSDQTYECDVEECCKVFATQRYLNRHKMIHMSKTSLARSDCNENTTYLITKPHIKSETQECNNGSSDKEMDSNSDTDYTQRQTKKKKSNVKTKGRFVCDFIECGKKFKTRDNLNEHKPLHLGLTFRCDVDDCRQVFAISKYLRRHKKNKHMSKTSLPGSDCNQNTTHLMVKTEIKSEIKSNPIETNGCDVDDSNAMFTTQLYLNKHMSVGHGFKYHLRSNYKTESQTSLTEHRISPSNESQFNSSINVCDNNIKEDNGLNESDAIADPEESVDILWIMCPNTDSINATAAQTEQTAHIGANGPVVDRHH
ncbi:unnamed protein product [Medioppia subpectinata]|uniref:C2H2-type domain-containing protein n=1 Tax=Medioppia subpectinata TaxID=1979941 RepID=A0A7R9KSL9_9ACAR|nr:unnamed protein product [Medioppia subpectinata]CAG2109025.1 unnamed protein product [Medioppia subpectinata]